MPWYIPLCTQRGSNSPQLSYFKYWHISHLDLNLNFTFISNKIPTSPPSWPNPLQEYGPTDEVRCSHFQQTLGRWEKCKEKPPPIERKRAALSISHTYLSQLVTSSFQIYIYFFYPYLKKWRSCVEDHPSHLRSDSLLVPLLSWGHIQAAFCPSPMRLHGRKGQWGGEKKIKALLSAVFPLCVVPGDEERGAAPTPGEEPAHVQGADAVKAHGMCCPCSGQQCSRAVGAVCHLCCSDHRPELHPLFTYSPTHRHGGTSGRSSGAKLVFDFI